MTTQQKEKITTRLLLGCHFTSEWKMLTHLSDAWKQMQILPVEQRELFIASHEGKEYLVCYIDAEPQTLKNIEKFTQDFRRKLSAISPKKDATHVPVVIFPQLFIA